MSQTEERTGSTRILSIHRLAEIMQRTVRRMGHRKVCPGSSARLLCCTSVKRMSFSSTLPSCCKSMPQGPVAPAERP